MADETRAYHSPLRERRAAETRRRILEAAVKVVGEGASQLTVPRVAKEAGVSVPTVYRYFGSKDELEDGIADFVRRQVGVARPMEPGLDGLLEAVRRNWTAAAEAPPGTLPVLVASIARNVDERQPTRRAQLEEVLSAELEDLDPEEAERVLVTA